MNITPQATYIRPYGHVIITSDLAAIPNSKLRNLIAKDPKYREPRKVEINHFYMKLLTSRHCNGLMGNGISFSSIILDAKVKKLPSQV